MVLAGGAGLGLHALTGRYDRSVLKEPLLDQTARRPHAAITGPLTYLLVGSDQRTAQPDTDARSDTIIIAHVPASLDRAYLISIPRDLLVEIPPGGDWAGGSDKVNAAFDYGGGGQGGARLLSAALSHLTGVRFDGAALIDFSGFRRVIDLLGGIRMCVDTPVRSIHTGTTFAAGCQQMTGDRALDYARQRYDLPNGDFDRQRHQQQLLRAILERISPTDLVTNPVRFDQVIRAIGSTFTVDTNGVQLEDLIFGLRGVRSDRLVGVQLPSHPEMIDETSYVLPDPEADGLYRALTGNTLDAWVTANPRWVNRL
ncbi:LCP family protein [Plantactinospora sp. GCM10030261]|uniref:LCP family protein n=1 Tax=Plantactinospora sp. GCM10030261 TaxID=3273420 RepID=UPI00361D896C